MRVWDVDVGALCDRHLLGEHRELHAIWSILTNGRSGYANHPETVRWRGRLAALHARHEAEVAEMARRGFNHASPLDRRLATGEARQTHVVDSLEDQRARLAGKECECLLAVPVEGEAHHLAGPRP
jgi:pyrimidine dimer DNA glycosylase